MNERHKYNLEETVCVIGDQKLGIVKGIMIEEELIITMNGKKYSRKVKYDVCSNGKDYFPCNEDFLKLSKKQFHKDSFKVKKGQVILRKGKEYIVESAGTRIYSGQAAYMGSPVTDLTAWHIEARELSNKEYNPKGRVIHFDQENGEPIEIVRVMKVETTYK